MLVSLAATAHLSPSVDFLSPSTGKSSTKVSVVPALARWDEAVTHMRVCALFPVLWLILQLNETSESVTLSPRPHKCRAVNKLSPPGSRNHWIDKRHVSNSLNSSLLGGRRSWTLCMTPAKVPCWRWILQAVAGNWRDTERVTWSLGNVFPSTFSLRGIGIRLDQLLGSSHNVSQHIWLRSLVSPGVSNLQLPSSSSASSPSSPR